MRRLLCVVLLCLACPWAVAQPDQTLVLASNDSFLPSPDALIAKTLQDIRATRMDDALREVNHLISIRPDFKLAHLIKGDLLLARAQPISGLGSVRAASAQSLSDLRDEARVRLMRYLDQPDPATLPRQILQLAPHQKYALLADAGRARLYLFENVGGEPRLKQDFYMTIGRNGTDKRVEGDLRTPAGVYTISERLPKTRLTDFYGAGAYPLNYPNDWDRAQGRGGHGIWIHGVPSDTYSRPPRSSEGCVVVTNPDLKELSKWVEVGATPVVIAERADWVDRTSWEQARKDLLDSLAAWKQDWETRSADRFLAHYSESFLQGNGRDWSESKRRNIVEKAWIKLELKDLSLFLYPGADMAYVDFTQHYSSDRLASRSQKRLYLQREAGQWRIALEKATELPSLLASQPPGGGKTTPTAQQLAQH
jgi:murein L,D-transpeptidase YafK